MLSILENVMIQLQGLHIPQKQLASCLSSRSNLQLERDCEGRVSLTLIITYHVCATPRVGGISRTCVGVLWGSMIRLGLFLPALQQVQEREAQVWPLSGGGSGQGSSLEADGGTLKQA